VLFWMAKLIMMIIFVNWIILISLENFRNIKLRNYEFFVVKINWWVFLYNEIIGEIINNKNRLINNDNLDQINLKNKTK
jgi:hypothetical protein